MNDDEVDAVLEKRIKPFGNRGAHITMSYRHLGRKATVMVRPKETKMPKAKAVEELARLEKLYAEKLKERATGAIHGMALWSQRADLKYEIDRLKKQLGRRVKTNGI